MKLVFDHVAREFVVIGVDSSYGELGDGKPREENWKGNNKK